MERNPQLDAAVPKFLRDEIFGRWARKCSTQSEQTDSTTGRTTQQTKQTRAPATDKKRRPSAFSVPHKEIQFEKQVLKSLGCVEGLSAGGNAWKQWREGCGVYFSCSSCPSYTTQHFIAQRLLGTRAINTCYIDCATACTIGEMCFDSRQRQEQFLIFTSSSLLTNQYKEALSPEIKRPGRDADNSSLSHVEVQNTLTNNFELCDMFNSMEFNPAWEADSQKTASRLWNRKFITLTTKACHWTLSWCCAVSQ
jgi:hypothetical protein